MNRVRRIAGTSKPKVLSAVQKDKDESIVFFRELYKREKDKDVNLLEPMYSVEFEAIQGELLYCCNPLTWGCYQECLLQILCNSSKVDLLTLVVVYL
jgi:hypothetical protein